MRLASDSIDIRLAVGVPVGESPIKVICPMHTDLVGSLAVYRSNINCFGCGYHVSRRYAALAFLLGEWSGRGDENGQQATAAVGRVKAAGLDKFLGTEKQAASIVPPIDPYMAESFHRYLLYREDKVEELQAERGLSLGTIRDNVLGYTGTHFTIPLFNLDGNCCGVRYRADGRVCDTHEQGYSKYEGLRNWNTPTLYPLRSLRGLHALEVLWIVEGEYDALISNQQRSVTLTVTNGAGAVARIVELMDAALPSLSVNRWVVAVDQDAAGEQCAEKLLAVLTDRGQEVVRAVWDTRYKDLSEYYVAGGSKREIRYAA
jgi:hypothetical protein